MRKVIALDPVIDTAMGEASDLRYRSRILQAAVHGLITDISAWRTLAAHLGRLPGAGRARDAEAVTSVLRAVSATPEEARRDPAGLRDACASAARRAARAPATTPSAQLLADAAASGLLGMARALNGLTLIADPDRTRREDALAAIYVVDWLPPAVVAARAFLTVALGFPVLDRDRLAERPPRPHLRDHRRRALSAAGGPGLFGRIGLSGRQRPERRPRGRADVRRPARRRDVSRPLPRAGTRAGSARLPDRLAAAAGVLHRRRGQPGPASGAEQRAGRPTRRNSTIRSSRSSSGLAVGTILIRLLPPPSPAIRTRRLLRSTLAELRALASGRVTRSKARWVDRMFARIVALPDAAEPVERAAMASALAVGTRIIRLRAVAPRFASEAAIDAALRPIAEGNVPAALSGLEALDRELTARAPEARIVPEAASRRAGDIRGVERRFRSFSSSGAEP